jgi:uncharacterized protein involved in response to NO
MLAIGPAILALATPAGHAHELLFGFALAAVAGNQLGPTSTRTLGLLAGTWLAARVSFLAAPQGLFAAIANGAFAALLAFHLAPRLFIRAKKLRNRALPAALVALCASAVASQVAARMEPGTMQRTVLVVAILVLSLLMLFMGGRIVAPAAAGQVYRQGGHLAARVQPRLEGALIVAMMLAIAAMALGQAFASGIAAMVAGIVALVRLARWRLWALRGRCDLLCLAAGYGWLALGLAGTGAALLAGQHLVTALHLVTVGAMGTLTINVMALTWLRLARRDPARATLPVVATLLVAAATVLRVGADFALAERGILLWTAAACWSSAYVLLLALFARTRRASSTASPSAA